MVIRPMVAHVGLTPCSFQTVAHTLSHVLFQKSFCTYHPLNLQAQAASSFLAEECSCYLPCRGYTVKPSLPGNTDLAVQACKRNLDRGGGCSHMGHPTNSAWGSKLSHWKLCSRTEGTVLSAKTTFSSPPIRTCPRCSFIMPSIGSPNCFSSLLLSPSSPLPSTALVLKSFLQVYLIVGSQ